MQGIFNPSKIDQSFPKNPKPRKLWHFVKLKLNISFLSFSLFQTFIMLPFFLLLNLSMQENISISQPYSLKNRAVKYFLSVLQPCKLFSRLNCHLPFFQIQLSRKTISGSELIQFHLYNFVENMLKMRFDGHRFNSNIRGRSVCSQENRSRIRP